MVGTNFGIATVSVQMWAFSNPSPKAFATIRLAIEEHTELRFTYRSMGNPEARVRIIEPHSLVQAGRRWHVRGYCSETQDFRDFVLGRMTALKRMEQHAETTAADDNAWNTPVKVRLVAHPALSVAQQAVVGQEIFAGTSARVETCRGPLVPYFIQEVRAAVDVERQMPPDYQLALANVEECSPVDVPELNAIDVARVQERFPPLFNRLPERLFAPLASPNRQRYWSLLCSLHNERFGPDAPLPPSHGFPVQEITKAIADEIRHQDWEAEGDGELTLATPLEIRANEAYNRLKDAGWLRADRVGVRDMVTMPPIVAHFMSRLMDFARTGPLFVAGKIRSIEANLKVLLTDDASGGDTLHENGRANPQPAGVRAQHGHERARPHERDRRGGRHEIVCAPLLRRLRRASVIGDYKELRTREHPLARRQEILRLATSIQYTDAIRERLLKWYSDKRAGGDRKRAETLFERDIQRIDELHRIDEYLDRLDDEIRAANKRALAFLDYKLKAARPLDHLIAQAIGAVLANPDAGDGGAVCPGPLHRAQPPGRAACGHPAQAARRAAPANHDAVPRGAAQAADRSPQPSHHLAAATGSVRAPAPRRRVEHPQHWNSAGQHRSGQVPAGAVCRRCGQPIRKPAPARAGAVDDVGL